MLGINPAWRKKYENEKYKEKKINRKGQNVLKTEVIGLEPISTDLKAAALPIKLYS